VIEKTELLFFPPTPKKGNTMLNIHKTFVLSALAAVVVGFFLFEEVYDVWLRRPDIVLASLAGTALTIVGGLIWLRLKVRRR